MTRQGERALRVGDWCVRPASGQISRGDETVRLEARTMRLLVCLAERAGEIVSIDDLLDRVWSGVTVPPDSVYQAVASLRRLLGDDPNSPAQPHLAPPLAPQHAVEGRDLPRGNRLVQGCHRRASTDAAVLVEQEVRRNPLQIREDIVAAVKRHVPQAREGTTKGRPGEIVGDVLL